MYVSEATFLKREFYHPYDKRLQPDVDKCESLRILEVVPVLNQVVFLRVV